MTAALAFLRLTRPVFLGGGALLYALGVALADGTPSLNHYILGQAMVTAIQLTAQYANEYFDIEADRLVGDKRTWLTGGSGVLVSGDLADTVALRAATATTAASLGLIGAVSTFNLPAGLVGLIGLAGAVAYSAPPARLVSSLLGVSTASGIVAILVPVTGGLVAGSLPVGRTAIVLAGLFLLHHAMLIAFERPDRPTDARAGKFTLSVRLGQAAAGRLHGGLIAGTVIVLGMGGVVGTLEWSALSWTLVAAPLAVWQISAYFGRGDTVLATGAVGLFALTTAALLMGQVG